MKNTLLLPLLFLTIFSQAQTLRSGEWKGNIHYQNHVVPFVFEIEVKEGGEDGQVPGEQRVVFKNGKERKKITGVSIAGNTIKIPLMPFDVTLEATFTETTMKGKYIKHYKSAEMPFTAEWNQKRFDKKSSKKSPKIKSKWRMTFKPDNKTSRYGAVGLFQSEGQRAWGTILTGTSDLRYFDGILDGDSLKLSSFDGAHAFMILGKKTSEGWQGTFVFDDNYEEPWIAVDDAKVSLPDPFTVVQPKAGTHKPYYDLLGAGSGNNAIDVSKYEGKVLIVQLFGTWCPNSLDQTNYLVDWYKKNKSRGVAILASSYEANYSQEYGLNRLTDYKRHNNIEYDLVLGGRLSKTAAAMPFAFMNRIEAFPTLVILDKSGFVRYVHSYFNGPATGVLYKEWDRRFNEVINELLAE